MILSRWNRRLSIRLSDKLELSELFWDKRVYYVTALPGTVGFQEVAEPLLNPVAQRLRTAQREFFDAVKSERQRINNEQTSDDERLAGGIISGVEWRKRYQDRSGKVSDMVASLKKT